VATLHPIVCADAEEMSRRAAERVAEALRAAPSLLLCAATGSTPTRAYEILAERRRAEPRLFAALRVLKLDEWQGLGAEAEGSCEAYLRRRLLGPLGVADDRYEGFRGAAPDPAAETARVAAWLAAHGPIDLCLLGLGLNGHLGFNEPGDELPPRAHLARLAEETRRHPMLGAGGTPPSRGFTLGLAEILRSRGILLLVSGREKREVLRRLLSGGLTTRLPASFLHLHGDVTLLCDRAAAG
jgi:galactosamine-6-phosphate isomerase